MSVIPDLDRESRLCHNDKNAVIVILNLPTGRQAE